MSPDPIPEVRATEKPGELVVVFFTRHDGKCAECAAEFFRGNMIRVENGRALCLECADLGHLEYLPRGDTALTRRAGKYSPLRAVVVEWSRTRQRYERQGILATTEAIQRAETECLADAAQRERQRARAALARGAQDAGHLQRMIEAMQRLFPGCPAATVQRIAEWTCQKYTGRVGRSAAAKELDPHALRLAVIAHIRHEHTRYDRLLMECGDRQLAREQVRGDIDCVLAQWEGG
jgi:hypothetical protein